MKKLIILAVSIILLLGMVSCSGGDVSKDETSEFLAQFEDTSAFTSERLNSEDEQTATYAMSDFFGKTGGVKGGLFGFPIVGIAESKVLDGEYGTYEWNDTLGWTLTDPNFPEDGYLYKWTFTDENSVSHDAQFLFDNLSFFEYIYDDPYGEQLTDTIPTSIHAALIVDEDTLVTFNYSSEINSNPMELTHLEATLTFVGHSEIEAEFDGSIMPDSNMEISYVNVDMARLRYTDIDDDWWEEYRMENLDESENGDTATATFVYENSNGWNVTVDATNTKVIENEIEYNRTDLTGEITKDGNHAANIEGVLWNPADENHIPYINIEYPDGTIEPIDITGIMGEMENDLGLK